MPPLTKSPALCLVLACAVLAGCRQGAPRDNQESADNAADQPVANVAAKLLLPQPAMDRAALLDAVATARSAAAAGVDDAEAQQQLDGKEFELRIRFGCAGPTASAKAQPLAWSLDRAAGVLRVHAAPNLARDAPVLAGMDMKDVETIEGFRIERPWLLQATCPIKPPAAPAVAATIGAPSSAPAKDATTEPQQPLPPAAPQVAIAQFFTASDARTAQRDQRPYEAVQKIDDGATVGQQGFDLVLSGRLRALPGGRVIRCVASSPDAPPACVISASFDHVWIEDAASKHRIADWSSS